MQSSRSDLAFTLIELLATIGVIVILASLIGIGAGRAKNAANQAVSIANLREIGVASLTYAADHNGKLPANGTTPTTTIGPAVGAESSPRRLFDSGRWAFGRGDYDYLHTPDVLYSPFALDYRSRPKNQLFQSASNSYAIGYNFYYIPRNDSIRTAAGKGPFHPDLFNDSVLGNQRTPLYSDIFYSAEEKAKKFPSNTMNVLFLGGSVKSFDYLTVISLPDWKSRLDYLATP